MSTLWTPDGEYRPKQDPPATPTAAESDILDGATDFVGPEDETNAAEVANEIRDADPAIIIANHCYGLFELAAIHLSSQPPSLAKASLAIDALAAIVDSLGDRLGDYAEQLVEGLAQLRLAFIQLSSIPSQPS